MGTINPYESPQAVDEVVQPVFADGEGYYREGKLLLVESGAELPDRCVYCNEPLGSNRKTCSSFWISILLGVASLVNVRYGVCNKHRYRQKVLWSIFLLLSFACVFEGILLSQMSQFAGYMFLTGFAATFVATVIVGSPLLAVKVGAGPPLRVRKADRSRAWLLGAQEPFLASLGERE